MKELLKQYLETRIYASLGLCMKFKTLIRVFDKFNGDVVWSSGSSVVEPFSSCFYLVRRDRYCQRSRRAVKGF